MGLLGPFYPLVGPQNRAVSIYQTVSLGSSVNKGLVILLALNLKADPGELRAKIITLFIRFSASFKVTMKQLPRVMEPCAAITCQAMGLPPTILSV